MRKPMMIVLTTLALAGTASGLAMAHGKGDGDRHERHQEKRLERMSEALELTDEQQAQVKALMADSSDRKADRDEKRELHRQIRDLDSSASDYDTRLDGLIQQAQQQLGEQIRERQAKRVAMQEILTDEQEAKLAEISEKRMEKMEKHGRRGGGHHQGW
ncbi:Spy/CpxP family protein refolding chaperone [Marinobacterium rhizophilum]|uniref:Spy/CpxP family protein refolding chaperone n=1 Tax=Marinobacterium rhizophilum TaxID=420402 RepID=A0ABY5HEB9_9GAMM|nr:Spy/CpxP family protein refolding chaperone [Marinobacterium rhizophilum]UTW10707.1 Spy/CpxP family protein refolding chaperone [Marinobacterium rhizophilum]